MRNRIIGLFMICCVLPVAAQQESKSSETLTLNDCMVRGLDKNFHIRMAKNRQEVSANNANPANAGLLPTVELSSSYSGDFGTSRTTSRATDITTMEQNAFDGTFDAGIELNWTVFDGFSVWTNYKQLKMMKEQGELQTRMEIEDYVASLASAYYNFIQQKIRLKNFHKTMKMSRERFRIVELNYHIGSYSLGDYFQAKVDFNADSTQYMKQIEALNTARITLNELLVNEDMTSFIDIRDTVINVNPNLHYEELWRATLATNSSLLLADKNSDIVRADYKKIMSRDYPYVRMNVGYGYTLNHYELAATRKRDNWGLNAGVTVGFNLFDGKRKMQKRNAQLDIEYANLERENLKLTLKSQLNDYWQAYKNNWQIVEKERENLLAATRNYEIADMNYQQKQISGFEMREAQNSLVDAEERILTAEYDMKMCEISLMLLSGKIVDYVGSGE